MGAGAFPPLQKGLSSFWTSSLLKCKDLALCAATFACMPFVRACVCVRCDRAHALRLTILKPPFLFLASLFFTSLYKVCTFDLEVDLAVVSWPHPSRSIVYGRGRGGFYSGDCVAAGAAYASTSVLARGKERGKENGGDIAGCAKCVFFSNGWPWHVRMQCVLPKMCKRAHHLCCSRAFCIRRRRFLLAPCTDLLLGTAFFSMHACTGMRCVINKIYHFCALTSFLSRTFLTGE